VFTSVVAGFAIGADTPISGMTIFVGNSPFIFSAPSTVAGTPTLSDASDEVSVSGTSAASGELLRSRLDVAGVATAVSGASGINPVSAQIYTVTSKTNRKAPKKLHFREYTVWTLRMKLAVAFAAFIVLLYKYTILVQLSRGIRPPEARGIYRASGGV
jgi:hypothetical protein